MTNNTLKSWINVTKDSDFTLHNIPFGIYSDNKVKHHACTAIGDRIIDLYELAKAGLINMNNSVFEAEFLNDFIALGKTQTNSVRARLINLLSEENVELRANKSLCELAIKKQNEVNSAFNFAILIYKFGLHYKC